MSRQWTKPQQQAIEDRGGTLLISAAAGSGKTSVLVERAVQLMTDEANPIAADRLLIVTFTRAAAEELRGRLAARLAIEAAQNPKNIWLRRQRLLLGRANISTIDAFCMQLLRRYFAQLDIPPDFTIADDATVFALRQNALLETLETMYDDADFCAFSSLYGRARSDTAAGEMLLALYDHLRSLPHPKNALNEICAAYQNDAPLCETPWGKVLLREAAQQVQAALQATQNARALVAQESALAGYDSALSEDAVFFAALAELLAQQRWDDALVYAEGYAFPALRGVRGYEGADKETVKALRDLAKKGLARLRESVFVCTEAEFATDRAVIAPLLQALAKAVLLFEEHFFAAKLREKVLEYSDFEHLSLHLLCTGDGQRTTLADTISAGFDAVMVDEYQDTNALQALLYRCLAKADESNLFFVGDVKQSIYRFRLANPESFIEKRESFSPYDSGAHPATIVLGNNFRSTPSVIDQINDVFAALMSRSLGDVDYTAEERLYPGAPIAYSGGAMELLLAQITAETKEMGDAPAVAQKIVQMVQQGFLVRGKDGTTRPCRYDDFCILLRSRANFANYEAALASCHVQAFADTGESWLTAPEIAPLLAMLRVIDNPAQDVSMAAVLLSVLFGFTPDDLIALRLAGQNKSLYTALLESEQPNCIAVCETLRHLRAVAATAPVEQLCSEIFAKTHYFAAVGAMENGIAARENLRNFTAFAAAACATGRSGLAGFLRYVDEMLQSHAPLGSAPPQPPEGSVAIMTIHRSKGLEFPICILADAARDFNLRDLSGHLLLHPVLGLGFDLRGEGGIYKTAPTAALAAALRREALSEEMRVLYVALTRAKDKLLVFLPHDKPESFLNKTAVAVAAAGGTAPLCLARMRNFGTWLCSFALTHPDGDALRKAAGVAGLPLAQMQGSLQVEILPPTGAAEIADDTSFVRTAQPNDALVQKLLANFARTLPLAPLSTLPAKLSVSALAHQEETPVLSRPAFLYADGLTAAEQGTAQHAFLQYADFAAAAQNLPAELLRLVQQKYLTPQIAEKLPQKRIAAFLQTPLAKRMQTADTLLREYDFITAVPARFVAEMPEELAYQPVLIQGIADAVILTGNTAEIVDYKTDRGKTQQEFLEAYTTQLMLYKAAVEKRLGISVTACTIYSFSLGESIDVPFTKITL